MIIKIGKMGTNIWLFSTSSLVFCSLGVNRGLYSKIIFHSQFNSGIWNRDSLFHSRNGIEAANSIPLQPGIEFQGNSGTNSLLNFGA